MDTRFQHDGLGQRAASIIAGAPDVAHEAVGRLRRSGVGVTEVCSGTLIGARTVLTAAHCIHSTGSYGFQLGERDYALDRRTPYPSWHPDQTDPVDDIGVVRLSEVPPIGVTAIAVHPVTRADSLVVLVGLGASAEQAGDHGEQRRVAYNTVHQLTDATFSIRGSDDGRGGVCHGDSGGPAYLVVDGVESQVGVASAGRSPCGSEGWYVRVSAYAEWIIAQAEGDLADDGSPAPAGPGQQLSQTSVNDARNLVGGCSVAADAPRHVPPVGLLPWVWTLLLARRRVRVMRSRARL